VEILRSGVVVMDVGVRPYSSKKSLQRPPFVGPLTDTYIHMDPTLTFFIFFYFIFSLLSKLSFFKILHISSNIIKLMDSNTLECNNVKICSNSLMSI